MNKHRPMFWFKVSSALRPMNKIIDNLFTVLIFNKKLELSLSCALQTILISHRFWDPSDRKIATPFKMIWLHLMIWSLERCRVCHPRLWNMKWSGQGVRGRESFAINFLSLSQLVVSLIKGWTWYCGAIRRGLANFWPMSRVIDPIEFFAEIFSQKKSCAQFFPV